MHFFFVVDGLGVAECDALSFSHMPVSVKPQSDRGENAEFHIKRSSLNN
jgi:hypothetical protein